MLVTGDALRALRDLMVATPDGRIGPDVRSRVEQLLAALVGDADDESVLGHKILVHGEDLRWERPWVSFTIVQRGGTALGPTRAYLQRWSVNVESGDAQVSAIGFQQFQPSAAPLRVGPSVEELVQAIHERRDHPALKWLDEASVRVAVAQINELRSDAGSRQTIADSRTRFREALARRMAEIGWQAVPNTRIVFERRDRA